jgi:hypothetical protein
MNPRRTLFAISLAVFAPLHAFAGSNLVVHEWGTFTSLQDEAGTSIGGINTDDEPVPDFVRRLGFDFLLNPSEAPPAFFQGAPRCHPDVTMRLETPVIYFYPAAGAALKPFEVRVAFHGGWLTEFYPDADATAPGFDFDSPKRTYPAAKPVTINGVQRPAESDGRVDGFRNGFGHLQPGANGELSWKGVKLGVDGAGPDTEDKVWLAPRAVPSAMLQTASAQQEKFLFYRGVGSASAGLRVIRDAGRQTLEVRFAEAISADAPPPEIHVAWLVDVEPDGRCAFRPVGALTSDTGRTRVTLPASFSPDEFSGQNLAKLQTEMRAALIAVGLFPPEADALLQTWEVSYFKSPGLRLFYLCPRTEVDRLLPLRISVPCDITRVMIGRIEIVTPAQRALLAKIAAGPSEELWKMRGVTADGQSDFFKNPDNMRRWREVMRGKLPYRELGLPIPQIYADYLALGRFRNALLLDEEKRRPTPALAEYIRQNLFDGYKIGTPPN